MSLLTIHNVRFTGPAIVLVAEYDLLAAIFSGLAAQLDPLPAMFSLLAAEFDLLAAILSLLAAMLRF